MIVVNHAGTAQIAAPLLSATVGVGRGRMEVADVIRGEFREMPCLSLTVRQAMRLWSLDEVSCRCHFERLCREGFLRVAADGTYRRAVE